MAKIKEVNTKNLDDVSGGAISDSSMVSCPNCNKRFSAPSNTVYEGSGCDEKAYFVCPGCGHKF